MCSQWEIAITGITHSRGRSSDVAPGDMLNLCPLRAVFDMYRVGEMPEAQNCPAVPYVRGTASDSCSTKCAPTYRNNNIMPCPPHRLPDDAIALFVGWWSRWCIIDRLRTVWLVGTAWLLQFDSALLAIVPVISIAGCLGIDRRSIWRSRMVQRRIVAIVGC